MSPLDHAQMLLKKAGRDLKLGEAAMGLGDTFDMASFHAQQAAEKSLKAILAADDIVYPKTHELGALLALTIPRASQLAQVEAEVAALSRYAVIERYDDLAEPDADAARQALDTARAVYDLAAALIHDRKG